jgi:hypothetical protein
MDTHPPARPARLLDPIDRVSEVLFGLIMVLTFTGSLSVAEAGRAEVREMLVGALGCNLAWGVIDALFFLMGGLAEKGRGLIAWHRVRDAADPGDGQRIIAGTLSPVVASLLAPPELEAMRQRLVELPAPPPRPGLDAEAWRGAFGILLTVFVSTFPVVVPFLFVHDAYRALRISNAVAVVMLFLCGYSFGRMTRYHPWGTGLAMVLLGCLLVAMTMALGG